MAREKRKKSAVKTGRRRTAVKRRRKPVKRKIHHKRRGKPAKQNRAKTKKPRRQSKKRAIKKTAEPAPAPVFIPPQKPQEENKPIIQAIKHEEKPAVVTVKKTGLNKTLIVPALIGVAALVLIVLLFTCNRKCEGAYAGLSEAAYENGRAFNKAGVQDLGSRYFRAIMKEAGVSTLKKTEREYFAAHFSAGQADKSGIAAKNAASISAVFSKNSAKIKWSVKRKCTGKLRAVFIRRGEINRKKTDAFAAAAGVLIPNPESRQAIIDYYEGPAVGIDTAADIAPYFMYYMAHAVVFDDYKGEPVPVYPPAAGDSVSAFFGMDGMFRVFEKKTAALEDLASIIEGAAGRKMSAPEIEKAKKAAEKVLNYIETLDMETKQNFIGAALQASLAARQWAKMENARHQKPWFETTYDDELLQADVDAYLKKLKKAKAAPAMEKIMAKAAALILYKTSRCMGTFESKKYAAYSENYRLSHAILMHFINSYDAALCARIADELDRYYAKRYYGTVYP